MDEPLTNESTTNTPDPGVHLSQPATSWALCANGEVEITLSGGGMSVTVRYNDPSYLEAIAGVFHEAAEASARMMLGEQFEKVAADYRTVEPLAEIDLTVDDILREAGGTS